MMEMVLMQKLKNHWTFTIDSRFSSGVFTLATASWFQPPEPKVAGSNPVGYAEKT